MKILFIIFLTLITYHSFICQETDSMPELIGGMRSMQDQIIYPEEAIVNNIQGIVYVKCTVTAEGSVKEIEILKGLGYGCDEEAVRIIKASKWKPGMINNDHIDIEVSIPLEFKLEDRIITI